MSVAVETDPHVWPCWACGGTDTTDRHLAGFHVTECADCGLVFQPLRTRADLVRLYGDEYFAVYEDDRAYDADERARWREAERRLELVRRYRPRGRLLEIGSAAGFFLAAARAAGYDVLGVEPSAQVARRSATRFGIEVRPLTIEDAEIEGGAFDVVCAWHVLEHLPKPQPVLERLERALGSGGYLILEVPNIRSARAQRERERWRPLDLRHHVAQYTPGALDALLRRTGFAVVELMTIPFAAYQRGPRAAAALAKLALITRELPMYPHPIRHELLQAVARVRR